MLDSVRTVGPRAGQVSGISMRFAAKLSGEARKPDLKDWNLIAHASSIPVMVESKQRSLERVMEDLTLSTGRPSRLQSAFPRQTLRALPI